MVTATRPTLSPNGSTGLLERRDRASVAASDRRLVDDAIRASDRLDSTERSTFEQTTRLARGE